MPEITGLDQVQIKETTTALGGSVTFTGDSRNMDKYDAVGVSIYIARDSTDTDVDVTPQHSGDNSTWRDIETVNLAVTAADSTATLNRVYAICRTHFRIKLVNKTANGLATTEAFVMQKPTS